MKKVFLVVIFGLLSLFLIFQKCNCEVVSKKEKNNQTQKKIVYQGNNVVYYDTRYFPASYVENIETLLNFLKDKNFYQQEADQLKDWMDLKISKNAPNSVCVMLMGIAPDTVAETMDEDCTIYKYMQAGGKVVWIGDTPFLYQGKMAKKARKWGSQGLISILDIEVIEKDHVSASVEITDDGLRMGVQVVDKATMPVSMYDVTKVLTKTKDFACSWFKNINKNYPNSGFIRYRATWYNGASSELNDDVYYLALYPKIRRSSYDDQIDEDEGQ
ncbi:MAG: hypothetical protein A2539_01455 [Elusimicrobia bacterium RIFOXYD2_FULL_34_15]|nr:MAG: hypothetical protein A2539_01455 [Elusimicrobia bacterium RIFOXYD2_FULL_34_15]